MKINLVKFLGWAFLPALLVLTMHATAQQWRPLTATERFNYRVDTASYITNTILADSTGIETGDSVFYLNRIVIGCPSCPGQDWKLYNQPQFLKKKMTQKPAGVYKFSEPGACWLNTLSALNDSWIFDSSASITAQVVSLTWESVLGELDSVKTISLSNGQIIRLSRDHGIVEFPVIGEDFHYDLEGIEGRNLGILVPGFAEFFNFNVGDVFQSRYEFMYYGTGNGGGGLTKITILSKDSSVAGYTYGVSLSNMQWYESMIGYHGDTSHYYGEGPLVYSDSSDHPCNLWARELVRNPVDPEIIGEHAGFMKIFHDTGQVISRQIGLKYALPEESPVYYYNGPDTLDPAWVTGFIRKYSTGLGEVYYEASIFEAYDQSGLIGYVKNGDTTGIVYPDEFILQGVSEAQAVLDIVIFPNPAQGKICFTVNGAPDGPIRAELYSSTGQQVFSCILPDSTGINTLDASCLPAGWYFLKLVSGSFTSGRGVILR